MNQVHSQIGRLAAAVLLISAGCAHAQAPKLAYLPAFPGAEGAGAKATGGRGGKLIEVINLNDSGAGSFREAVDATGPRIIVFRVSGTIELKSRVNIRNGDVTIAGQTAPGGGICLKGYSLNIAANNVILRYLRTRLGDETAQQSDAMTVARNAQNLIIDHCTSSWSIDEALSLAGDNTEVTIQWCLVAEALRASKHAKGEHGFGSLVRATGLISLHHNLWAHNDARNPRMGDTYGQGAPTFDFRNNVIYDFGKIASGVTQGNLKINYVGNYLRPGPSSKAKTPIKIGAPSDITLYIKDNVFEGNAEQTADNAKFVDKVEIDGKRQVQFTETPFAMEPVKTTSAKEAYEAVLAGVGASLPARDAVDSRIIQQVRDRGGQMIDSQTQVGGWPELKSAPAPLDTDHDGMPDEWEKKYGLDLASPADGNKDADRDGYTNIEEYLNGSDPTQLMDYKDPNNNTDPRLIPAQAGLHTDVEYGQAGGEKLILDAFNPQAEKPAPVAVILHGGGWGSGSKSGDITPVREALSAAGFAWFSINYRLAPAHRWPACYEDVETALRWVKAHAAEYGGDPNRMALIGYSAGGHLACRACVLAGADTRVQAAVGLAAPTDMVADTERRGGLSPALQALLDMKPEDAGVAEKLVMLSPLNDIKPGLPPFLLIHGTVDKSVPFDQSVQFQKRLQEAGVECELVVLEEAPHAIANWPQSDAEYLDKMVGWLRKTV